MVEAGDPLGGSFGCGQGGQQHAGEDSDDGHHHQEFDEGEALLLRGWLEDHGLG